MSSKKSKKHRLEVLRVVLTARMQEYMDYLKKINSIQYKEATLRPKLDIARRQCGWWVLFEIDAKSWMICPDDLTDLETKFDGDFSCVFNEEGCIYATVGVDLDYYEICKELGY